MTAEASFLLAILRDPAAVVAPDSLDWPRLLEMAETHGVLPAFCKSYSGALPPEFAESSRRHWTCSAFLASELERLLAEFAGLTLVAITRGDDGSLLVGRREWHSTLGFRLRWRIR